MYEEYKEQFDKTVKQFPGYVELKYHNYELVRKDSSTQGAPQFEEVILEGSGVQTKTIVVYDYGLDSEKEDMAQKVSEGGAEKT